MRSIISGLFILALFFSWPVVGREMAMSPPGLNPQTVTRDVATFTEREQNLLALLKSAENSEPTILADDFEVWSDKANDWQSKVDWLKSVKGQEQAHIHNLSVRLMDDLAVVSFLLEYSKGKHKKSHQEFVVDVWRQSTQQLTVRYVSEVSNKKTSAEWLMKKI